MTEKSAAAEKRAAKAARSAGRAAGYCWLEHPSQGAHCTRPPHTDRQHEDFYNGRTSPTASKGFEWEE